MLSGTESAVGDALCARCAADAPAIRVLRRQLAEYLVERGSSAELAQRALLVASELLTNALEATTDDDIELTAVVRGGRISITVENRCGSDPQVVRSFATVAMPAAVAERGRGLPLVAAVAARLSITFEEGTVRVSADLLERT